MNALKHWLMVITLVIAAIALPAYMIWAWGWAEAFLGCIVLAVVKFVLVNRTAVEDATDGMARAFATGYLLIALLLLMVVSYIAGLISSWIW